MAKIAKAVTVEMAAPTPCIALEAIRDRSEGAKPQVRDATVKIATPIMKSFFVHRYRLPFR